MLRLSDASAVAPSADEAASLAADGFVLLQDVVEPRLASVLRLRLDELLAAEGDRAGEEFRHLVDEAEQAEADHIGDLLRKDPLFEACLLAPRVLGAVHLLIGDEVRLHAMNARNPLAGGGNQVLHAHPGLCNTLWLLDDMQLDNGPTRVVPGSHLWEEDLDERDWALPFPGERFVTAAAGSVIVLDPRVLHGGTKNRCGRPRRVITTAYSRPDVPPQY